MNYIFNFKSFNENYKHLRKPKHPFSTMKASHTEPIESGCVLILSNPIFEGKRKIYMGIIDKIRKGKNDQYEVLLTGTFYILKKHLEDKIMPEKIGFIDSDKKIKYLNMTSDGIVLNNTKTPLWEITSKVNKINLFTNYQQTLKNLEYLKDVVIPFTMMSNPVNLHE